jgi:FlaA1/EpsC-like NDP-sugar epimerase
MLDVILIGGIRFSYRAARRIRNNGVGSNKNFKRVMIIGAGQAGALVIKELKNHEELNSMPVAVIDDDDTKLHRKINGVPVLGDRYHIRKIAERKKIDEIIIAIPSSSRKEIKEILEECSKTKCKLKMVPGIYELIDGQVSIQKIRDVDIEDLLGRDSVKVDLEQISGYVQNKTVLITGGGGSIGSELCRQIATFNPEKLLIVDIYENNAYDIQNELIRNYPELDLEVLIASVRDRKRMEEIFSKYKPNVVFHAAAHKHVPLMETSPQEAIKNNVFGTLNVAECADKYGVEKFVLISTDKAVNPTNVMGATKRITEMIVQCMSRKSKTEFVAVRFGNVLGSNGSVIPLFRKQIAKGGPVTVTHEEVTRFFMTIPEAAQLVIQAGGMA